MKIAFALAGFLFATSFAAADSSTSQPVIPTTIQTYDIHQLVQKAPDYLLSEPLEPTLPDHDANNVSGSSTASLFGGGLQSSGPSEEEQTRSIVHLIEASVDEPSWKDKGGKLGSITSFDDKLVIDQTVAAHSKIRALLDSLAETANESLSTTACWVELTHDEAAKLQQGNGVIDDEALAKLKIYCQSRLTGFNGQTVHASTLQEHSYVSAATPVIASDFAAFTPTISTIRDGVALQVKPTLAGESVVIDVLSIVGKVSGLTAEPLELHSVVATTTQPADAHAQIVQRPVISSQVIQTTMKLSLGKNVFVGGMTNDPNGGSGTNLCLVLRVNRQ